MAQRGDHAQTLARLQLMYQDARRSAKLRAEQADTLRRRIVTMRVGYRSAPRTTLQVTLAEQAAHKRLAAQFHQESLECFQAYGD
jgi:hypothetical protein